MRPVHDKNYFHFSRKERHGILFLTGLAIISVSVSIFYPYVVKSKSEPASAYAGDIAKLKARSPDTASKHIRYTRNYNSRKNYSGTDYNTGDGELFYFDPNTISHGEWKKLGLRDKTIAIIQNYLAKGGRFREAADIKKIWGLHEQLADRIIPYARIKEMPAKLIYNEKYPGKSFTTKTYAAININEVDTATLVQLPGIGPKLSQRILKYRDRLGGFYAVDQVAETFGLPDSTFQKMRVWLKVDKGSIKTININAATIDELKAHPYIRYHLANALVQYRLQHKSYSSVNEIRNIMLVDDTTFQKVAPYLAID